MLAGMHVPTCTFYKINMDRKSNVCHAVGVINVLVYFAVVTLLFQLLAKHSSAALPCKGFVGKHLNLSCTTPHPNH